MTEWSKKSKYFNVVFGEKSEVLNLDRHYEECHEIVRCYFCNKKTTRTLILEYTYRHLYHEIGSVIRMQYFSVCSNCDKKIWLDTKKVKKCIGKHPIPFFRKHGSKLIGYTLLFFLIFRGTFFETMDQLIQILKELYNKL